uniref:NAD-dependent protein deacetylase n=1 Tax=Hirondellea gigas TaxID=1518452 RepID=A0A6A7G102_9CRUS
MMKRKDESSQIQPSNVASKKAHVSVDQQRRSDPKDDDEDQDSDIVEWISSHLFGSVIWSSDHEHVPVDYVGPHLKEVGDPNLFVVQQKCGDFSEGKDSNGFLSEIAKAAHLLKSASSLLVIAGAGMCVDSGLPDYRSPNGFWNDYKPIRKLGISLTEMSESDWFRTNINLAWGFYAHRIKMYSATKPHNGFQIIKNLADHLPLGHFVFTSNIDSQFQAAGFPEDRIFESHGSLQFTQCRSNCSNAKILRNKLQLRFNPNSFELLNPENIDKCEICGDFRRPNVSFFSDSDQTYNSKRIEKQKSRLITWLYSLIGFRKEDCSKSTNDCEETIYSNSQSIKLSSLASNAAPTSPSQKPATHSPSLVVLEIGCGVSLHSLRCESDELLRKFSEIPSQRRLVDSIDLIRINPLNWTVPKGETNVGIGLGALEALQKIQTLIEN